MTVAAGSKRSKAALRAVIIYDAFESATRATALLERVAARADESVKWDIKPWRFEVLNHHVLSAVTVAVAVNADLIVLALGLAQSRRPELLDWLKNWATNRRIQDAALLVLPSETDQVQESSSSWGEVEAFAKAQRLVFFFADTSAGEIGRSDGFSDGGWQRERTALELARVAAEQSSLPSQLGINE